MKVKGRVTKDRPPEKLEGIQATQSSEQEHFFASIPFSILSAIPHAVIGVKNRIIMFANERVKRIFGYEPEELIGKTTRILYRSDEEYEEVGQLFYPVLERQKTYSHEFFCRRKDGEDILCRLSTATIGETLKEKQIVAMYEDITEVKKTGEALRESEELYRTLIEASNDAIAIVKEGRHLYVNQRFTDLFGYSKEEATGKPINFWIYPDNKEKVLGIAIKRENDSRAVPDRYEFKGIRKDGSLVYVEVSASRFSMHGETMVLAILRDITERKKAEEELQKEKELFFTVLENNPNGIALIDTQGKYFFVNSEFTRITGYTLNDIPTGRDWFKKAYPDQRYRKKVIDAWKNDKDHVGATIDRQFTVLCHDGTTKEIEFRTTFLKEFAILVLKDITFKIEAENALKEAGEKYRSIFEHAVEGIFQSTLEGGYLSVNPSFAKMLGYDSPQEVIESIKDIRTQVYAFPEDRDTLIKHLQGHGFIENFETRFWRKDGSVIWVSSNTRAVKDSSGKILYLEGTNENITERKMAEEALQKSMDNLRKLLVGTIQAISTTVETRDPYTAGHQKRVSQLARTIAQEMSLHRETIEGIRVAGIIHDIGKISVPAEILSKPTRLTELEFNIIKTHSEVGYEILKGIEFPWPIAKIVLQHHERLNGSGYPYGIKDGEILLEAKILAVADVTESMISHRPYRAALGIDAALEELTINKGILYDRDVANACIALFKEKGFSF